METIQYSDFEKIQICIGTIIKAETFPEARKPAYKLLIDFGTQIGQKRSSAQITAYYAPEDLEGKQVVAVVNFPEKQVGPFMSQCLVLGIPDGQGAVILLQPERPVDNGLRIS
jgi:tRNA-binding protein